MKVTTTRNKIKTRQSWTILTHHVFFHLRNKSRKTAVRKTWQQRR